MLNTIEELKTYNIGVLILDGRYWTFNMDETDILRLAVDGGMAQGESMRTAKRVNNGVESYRKNGQLVVSGLFGYEYVLASGEINHSETGENSQFQSDRKSQHTSFSFL